MLYHATQYRLETMQLITKPFNIMQVQVPVARVNGQVIFTKVLARAASKKQGAKTAHIRTLPP